jgi:hypothetical protein
MATMNQRTDRDLERDVMKDTYECIDPELGDALWQRDDPDVAPEMRARLDNHVAHCAACRLRLSVEGEVAEGLRTGWLHLPHRRGGGWGPAQILTTSGLLAVAASLLLIFTAPPRAALDRRPVRGPSASGIIRPVPDEEIASATPTLRWHAVEDATRYEVAVRGVANGYEWHTSSAEAAVTIPETHPLPPGSRYRIIVTTVPTDLAPGGGWRGSFSRVPPVSFIGYRLTSGSRLAQAVGVLGLCALLASAAWNLRRRRSPQPG